MNNIKFRAYVHELDEICEVDEISYNEDGKFDIGIDGYADLFTSDECDIEQFIGLLDKNGKEIYEGDIVKDNDEGYLIVKYCNDNASYILNLYMCDERGVYKRVETYNFDDFIDNSNFEVIGNIHENKELMKGLC